MKRIYNLFLVFIFSFSVATAQPGAIDFSFNTDFDFGNADGNPTNGIYTLVIQPDGKIILGGSFSVNFLNGDRIQNIIRLNIDGSLDPSFKIGIGSDNMVYSLILQQDGRIIVGGTFDHFNKIKCAKLVRLNEDGSIDFSYRYIDTTNSVFAAAMQPNNKILVATAKGLGYESKLERLNENGELDSSFNECRAEGAIVGIFLQKNGKVILRGDFDSSHQYLTRLNSNGSLDSTFIPLKKLKLTECWVGRIVLQPDGKILIGGKFISNTFSQINNILRFEENGNLDSNFRTKTGFGYSKFNAVSCIHLQKDGKIILGGKFNSFNGLKNKNIVRLNADGSLDSEFNTGEGFDNLVSHIVPQGENKIIVTGLFDNFDSYISNRITRLKNDDNFSELNFSISPNPNTGKFSINASQPLKLIVITTILGTEILRIEPMSQDVKIDITNHASGLYFVKFFSENASHCQKIFKH